MASIYIETFGCQMNEADSEFLAGRARSAGYTVASRPEEANIVVLNTCTVREAAERRAYGRMHHFKRLKDADPALKLVVTGCLAEQDRERMQTIAPHLDGVFGTSELRKLGDAIERWRPDFEDTGISEERALLDPFGGAADCVADAFSHLRGFVTVQRGCSYYCTFCIVPHVRGRFDHRRKPEILAEVNERVAHGAREVMLVGQTVNAYRDPVGADDFAALCHAAAGVAGLEQLSFISPHPKDFTEAAIASLAQISVMAPRVHLPLQSASDPVLRRMNRKYTIGQYDNVLRMFRRHMPHWAVTTDLIVGFPGESDEDFERTLEYVQGAAFSNAYMFIYSPRRGTPAARWEQVSSEVAHERFDRLVAAQNENSRAHNERKLGSVVRALVQGPSKKDPLKIAAKWGDNATIVAPLPPGMQAEALAATPWIDVAVDRAFVWGCTGRMVARAAYLCDPGEAVEAAPIDLIA